MTDEPNIFVEFREGGKICVGDFDNGSNPYVCKGRLDAAIARAEKAEAQLAIAIKGLAQAEVEIDVYIRQEYPSDHPVHELYRKRDYAANSARLALAQLPGD